MKKRSPFSREFKVQVIREVESGTPVAQVALTPRNASPMEAFLGVKHQIHPSLIHKWIKQYQENPENAFFCPGKAQGDEAKIAELQRTLGELYMENTFLRKTLKHLEMRWQQKKGETYQSS